MKKTLAVLASSTLLAACGGGSSTPAEQAASRLSAYAGTWQSPCEDSGRNTISITRNADGSLQMSYALEHFEAANCAGTPYATQGMSANTTVSHAGTADALVKLGATGAASTVRIDNVSLYTPAHTTLVTGKDLQYTVDPGQPGWCHTHADKSRSCIADAGALPAMTQAGALYLQGDKLYRLSPDAAGYAAEGVLIRK